MGVMTATILTRQLKSEGIYDLISDDEKKNLIWSRDA